MKSFKFALAALALHAALRFSSRSAAASPAAPQKPAGPALLPKGKIAVINTAAFQEKVDEFKAKIEVSTASSNRASRRFKDWPTRSTRSRRRSNHQTGVLAAGKGRRDDRKPRSHEARI